MCFYELNVFDKNYYDEETAAIEIVFFESLGVDVYVF